jgi:hypothetical protein
MGMRAGRESWPLDAHDQVDPMEILAASMRQPARWLPSCIVLGLLLISIVLFALGHPS